MDRDNRWQRVEKAYDCLTGYHAKESGLAWAPTAAEAIQRYYDHPTNDSQCGDEFILPTPIAASWEAASATRISDGDSVIFYNYRGDRPREIIRAFTFPTINGPPSNLHQTPARAGSTAAGGSTCASSP